MQAYLKKILLPFVISFLISDPAFAQETPAKPDSTTLYKNIEAYSRQSRFKTFIYRSIFRPATPVTKNKAIRKKTYKNLIQKPYDTFEGKIIRNIEVVTFDPFGYSISDTIVPDHNFLRKAGNGMHIKTRGITIRNLLLFHRKQPFNSLLVKESERLIRSQKYVHEVAFSVVEAGDGTDSVDISVRVLDKGSIIPVGSISASGIRAGLSENNFLGYGHEFQNVFSRDFNHEINAFNTNYNIPNIRNTYISAKLHLGFDGYNNSIRSFAIDRPFFSPLAKWSAGISFATQVKKDSLKDINSVYVPVNLKFRTQDFWAGSAQQIFKGRTEAEHITNLILAARYLRVRYLEKPSENDDPLHIYSSEDFYLATIGMSTRIYVQDKFIFKHGVIEDVPVGRVYALTGGYQVKNNTGRLYLGMRVFFGNYNKLGYLSSNFEYGTFFHGSQIEQGVLTVGVNYFTGLFEIGIR